MSRRNLLTVFTVAIIFGLSCSEDNPVQSDSGDTDVQIIINFETNTTQQAGLGKSAAINRVVIAVTGPGMTRVTEQLTLNSATTAATGSIKVPKGNNRKFIVNGIDGSSIIQFKGETTQDIVNDVESVSISVSWTPPDPVTLSVSNVTTTTATLSWNTSTAPDFLFYRVLLSTSSNLIDPIDQIGGDITSVNSTGLNIINLSPGTTYYVAVMTVDTELRFSGNLGFGTQNSIVKSFSALSQILELSYDDNSFENGLVATEVNESLIVHFTSPSYPVKIVAMDLYIWGTQEFTTAIFDFATGDFLGGGTTNGVDAANYTWASYDLSAFDINVTGDFFAGIRYTGPQQTDGNWWPAIGLDQTSSAGRSYDDLPSSGLFLLDDLGFPGNLGIRVTIELGGTGAQTLALITPESITTSKVEWDEQLQLRVGISHHEKKLPDLSSKLIKR